MATAKEARRAIFKDLIIIMVSFCCLPVVGAHFGLGSEGQGLEGQR